MGWLSNNTAEVAALGSIFMDLATLVIIFFNINQFKLNRNSLNIDINFKVFDQRKKIYREIDNLLDYLRVSKNFLNFIDVQENSKQNSTKFDKFVDLLDNSKYLFAQSLYSDIERLIFLCQNGVAVETKIQRVKEQDPSLWNDETTKEMQDLNNKRTEIIEGILAFETDNFLPYLNVSNFHLDFISEKSRPSHFWLPIISVKKAAQTCQQLIAKKKLAAAKE